MNVGFTVIPMHDDTNEAIEFRAKLQLEVSDLVRRRIIENFGEIVSVSDLRDVACAMVPVVIGLAKDAELPKEVIVAVVGNQGIWDAMQKHTRFVKVGQT